MMETTSLIGEVLKVSVGDVEYQLTLAEATETKRQIGRDASQGKLCWGVAAKLLRQILDFELGVTRVTTPGAISVDLRSSHPIDLPEMLAIEAASSVDGWDRDDFLSHLEHMRVGSYVALRDDEVLGYIIYRIHTNELELLNLAVHPHYRRRRVGAQLVGRLIHKLRESRWKSIKVISSDDALEEHLFFQAMGFVGERVIRDCFDDGCDGYVLRRWFNYRY